MAFEYEDRPFKAQLPEFKHCSLTLKTISVTDDKDVAVDTAFNILSEILLTSDLKGHVANPAWYLNDHPEAAADLLMLTHGWTRYDIPKALRGEFRMPEIPPPRKVVNPIRHS